MENDTKHWRELAVYEETKWGVGSQVAVALRTAADTVDRLNARIATLEKLLRNGLGLADDSSYARRWSDRVYAALGDNDE